MEGNQPSHSEAQAVESGRRKEGSYASSVIPTQSSLPHEGSMNRQDLGLTLLPGSQIPTHGESFLACPGSDVAKECWEESRERSEKGTVIDDRRFRTRVQGTSQGYESTRKRKFRDFESQDLPPLEEGLYSAKDAMLVDDITALPFSQHIPLSDVNAFPNNRYTKTAWAQHQAFHDVSRLPMALNREPSTENVANWLSFSNITTFPDEKQLRTSAWVQDQALYNVPEPPVALDGGPPTVDRTNKPELPNIQEHPLSSDSTANDTPAQLKGPLHQPKSSSNRSAIHRYGDFLTAVIWKYGDLRYFGSEVGKGLKRIWLVQGDGSLLSPKDVKGITSYSPDERIRYEKYPQLGVTLYLACLDPEQIAATGNWKPPQPNKRKDLSTGIHRDPDSPSCVTQSNHQNSTHRPFLSSSSSTSNSPRSDTFSEICAKDDGPTDDSAFEAFLDNYNFKTDPMDLNTNYLPPRRPFARSRNLPNVSNLMAGTGLSEEELAGSLAFNRNLDDQTREDWAPEHYTATFPTNNHHFNESYSGNLDVNFSGAHTDGGDPRIAPPATSERAIETQQGFLKSDPLLTMMNIHYTSDTMANAMANTYQEAEANRPNANQMNPYASDWITSVAYPNADQHLNDLNHDLPDATLREEHVYAGVFDESLLDPWNFEWNTGAAVTNDDQLCYNTYSTTPNVNYEEGNTGPGVLDHQMSDRNTSAAYPSSNHHHNNFNLTIPVSDRNTSAAYPNSTQHHNNFNLTIPVSDRNISAAYPNTDQHHNNFNLTIPNIYIDEEYVDTRAFGQDLVDPLNFNLDTEAMNSNVDEFSYQLNTTVLDENPIEQVADANSPDRNPLDPQALNSITPASSSGTQQRFALNNKTLFSNPRTPKINASITNTDQHASSLPMLPPSRGSSHTKNSAIQSQNSRMINPDATGSSMFTSASGRRVIKTPAGTMKDIPAEFKNVFQITSKSPLTHTTVEENQCLREVQSLRRENQRLQQENQRLQDELKHEREERQRLTEVAGQPLPRSTTSIIGGAGLQHQAGAITPGLASATLPIYTPFWNSAHPCQPTAYQSPYAPISRPEPGHAPGGDGGDRIVSNRDDPITIASSASSSKPSDDGLEAAIAEELADEEIGA